MKKITIVLAIIFTCIQISHAEGVLTQVYLNPVGGDDARDGSMLYPVKTWDKALSLAADNATIYISSGSVNVTSNMTFDGSQYGATNITATPYTGYTGALFAIADNVTGTFSNLTLKGTGTAQTLLSVNNRGTMTIGANVSIIDGGEIALDGGAYPINLTAAPPAGMSYLLLTTYSATDEGRIIVNTGSVASPLQYFTLVEPQNDANVDYGLELEGSTIRLYEFPKGGIYLDPLNGNDAYSGAKSSRPVKTLARAIAQWDSRNTASPGIVTDIYILSRITLTANMTLDNGLQFTRFAGDADRSAAMTDYLFFFTGYELTVNHATINNGTITGTALYSESNGTLTLNDGATILSGNTSNIIENRTGGTTVLNDGSTITKTGTSTSGYCINNYNTGTNANAKVIVNGGTITTNGVAIYKYYGYLEINGGIITHSGTSYCIYNYSGTAVINDCDITTTGTNAIYNSSSTMTINDGIIRNVRTSAGNTLYNTGSYLIINGGSIEGGLTTAIYNTYSTATAVILNCGNFSSTNTETGTVYSSYHLQMNGENTEINGIIYMASPYLDTYFITIISPAVTQPYTIRIADGAYPGTLVKSNPVFDLGLYRNLFTLETKPGYALTAYANKGEANRNLVVYDDNGIYVNDYTGDDANAGTSPDVAVKTLENAAGKTTSAKTSIYICDSTLTINAPQTITPSIPKDTIRTFLFRSSNTNLLRVTAGGDLTLQNMALFTPFTNVNRFIMVDNNGSLQMNTGAVIFMYNSSSTSTSRYGIYLNGGSVVMNGGSKITSNLTANSNYGYAIYATGNTSTLSIADNVIIERQYFPAITVTGNATATIGAAILQYNSSSYSYAPLSVSNGIVDLNGTIIQNNNYRALTISGANTIVNMYSGLISNNGVSNTSSYYSESAVSVESQATFNFSGGTIENYYLPVNTSDIIYGAMVHITSGGKMNFSGGTITGSDPERNAIFVNATGTTVTTAGHLTLSNQATLNNGYIYCSSPYFAPVHLSQTLDATKLFHINLGDNMAGTVLVDGTSANTFPASVGNFDLNPLLTNLSLQQSGDDVIVGSTAIYLHGTNGNDTNDGSSAIKAVKTFTKAKERLQATAGNEIIVIGAALLSNADESTDWDLSFNPNAVVRRGLGYTGYLVNAATNRSLTFSDITFDGNKENVAGTAVNPIIYGGSGTTITINAGTSISNNDSYGIRISSGSIYMNGGEIADNNDYGIYISSSASREDEFIMTDGIISNNNPYGVYSSAVKYIRFLGGEIKQNNSYGFYTSSNHSAGVMEISGTARIVENKSIGIASTSSNYLDSLIISGGEIANNTSHGISQNANHVLITGGLISNNNSYGIQLTGNSALLNTSCTITDVTIQNNNSRGLNISNYDNFSMTGGNISYNGGYGFYASGSANHPASDFSITGGSIQNNTTYGLYITSYVNMSVENAEISNNNGVGIYVSNGSIALPGNLAVKDAWVHSNTGYGFSLNSYLTSKISGNTLITNNKSTAIYSNSFLSTTLSDDVLIKGNRSLTSTSGYAGGIYVTQGTIYITDNVTLEADTSTYYAGGINVATTGNAVISGNVKIKDCVNLTTSSSYGGTAIYAAGTLSMTGGSITGCTATAGRGTVYVSGTSSDVRLNNVTIQDNTANYGGAIYVNTGGRITLDSDTIINNTTIIQPAPAASPVSGEIHIVGSATGRLSLRDKNLIEGNIFINSTSDKIYVDEALLFTDVGAIRLLANNSGTTTNLVTAPGTVVVSPNGTTVTDASQFLTRFTLMNKNGRGLDKGGTDDNHIIVVNEFFIDGSYPTAGNGASPFTPFNSLSQADFLSALGKAYTTVWVSGPVKTTGTHTLPVITQNNVNLRRYTGFAVAAQPYPAYDSVMITIEPGTSLVIQGGNSPANTFTISGEGGSAEPDASIFKNYGVLTLGGYTNLYFNPIKGNGAAVNQNGTFNLSGHVDFNLYSPNTVYLAEDKVINITGPLTTTTPIGITVETSPSNTHSPARIVVVGTTANVPAGIETLFYNEITPDPLPIGRFVDGTDAGLMFYLADRNVAGVPIYTKLQDAFDAAVPANNDEVRLYGNTQETIFVDKRLQYNSNGYAVKGSFTLDSVAQVQLLDDLIADTLYIRATTFSNKAQLGLNNYSATIADAAYLDLQLPADAAIGDWYPVNLPFDAKVSDIRDASDTMRQVLHLQDFGIAAFDSQRRATHGIGNQPSNPNNDWQFFTEPTMANGKAYMVTGNGLETLRFKAANLNLFATLTAPAVHSVGPTANIHHGFNYLAQPLPINAVISDGIPVGAIVQVSENLSSDRIGAASYVAKMVSPNLVIAPYTNYFYQTNANSIVTYAPTIQTVTVWNAEWGNQTSSDNGEWRMQNAEWGQTSSDNGIGDSRLRGNDVEDAEKNNSPFSILHSPFKKVDSPLFYELRLYDNSRDGYDALFVAASEYASKERYEIGRDVVKMGTVGHTAQIWSVDFDVALCADEVLMENGSAYIPLFIHTPVAGKKYHLTLQNVVNRNDQLWLYRAGKPVQDLTVQPNFTIEGTGHTTDEYSLLIQSGTTFCDPVGTCEVNVNAENNAIVINGLQLNDKYSVYDLSGRLYATGTATGNLTRIYIARGTYIVQINGISHKVIVN